MNQSQVQEKIDKGRPKPLTFKDKVIRKLEHLKSCFLDVTFDKRTGMYVYELYGEKIYIKYRYDVIFKREHFWKCHEIYFKDYEVKDGDVILDFGAGYGEEAAFLASKANNLTYIGFEILPSVYECISNTFGNIKNGNFRCCPFAVTPTHERLMLPSQYKYSSVGNTENKGVVEAFGKPWTEIKALYDIDRVDLFKMNIEGSETTVLSSIDDFSKIKRFAIECHDFRAQRGHGEHFRTKRKVIDKLESEGYEVSENHLGVPGYEWADGWIHAVKKDI